jgi:hypothetical protein
VYVGRNFTCQAPSAEAMEATVSTPKGAKQVEADCQVSVCSIRSPMNWLTPS